MNKVILFLIALMTTSLIQAQDLQSLLNPSLRALDNFHDAQNPMSCFDYSSPNPVIPQTQRGPRCSPANRFTPVPVGKYRTMTRQQYRSGNYLLSRTGEKKYQAILNMKFVADPNPPVGQAGTPELARQILQRTKNCMKEMQPLLKGPKGEELEIVLLGDGDVLPEGMNKPDETRVKVSNQPKDFRGDAGNFGSNFECTTIGHEMLHHLGLCDEYNEGIVHNPGYDPADWSCRPVTAAPSYMRNMHFAMQATAPMTSRCECDQNCQDIMNKGGKAKEIYLSMNGAEILNTESSLTAPNTTLNPNREICTITSNVNLDWDTEPAKAFELASENGSRFIFNSYRVNNVVNDKVSYNKLVYTCNCQPHQEYCQKMMQQLKDVSNNIPKRVTCPDGLRANSTAPSIGSDPSGSRMDDCRTVEGKRVCDLVLTSPGNGKSLLAPSHFNRMLGGNCEGSSPQYERCERYAYIGKNTAECRSMPRECLDDNYYMNSPLGPLPATLAR